MEFSFEIFPEEHLIIESFSGELTRSKMFEAFLRVWSHPAYQRTFRGLSDIGDAHFNMTLSEFRAMEEEMYRHPLKCQGKWAWVSDTPSSTAYGILHEKASQACFKFSVFSDWTSGFRWVEQPLQLERVERVRKKRSVLV
ncbi:MAG: hypothetical protein AAF212_09395 [Verrucomicrobiota bacterium]